MRIPVEPSDSAPGASGSLAANDALKSLDDFHRAMRRFGNGLFNRGGRSYPQPRRQQPNTAAPTQLTAQDLHAKHTALRAKYSSEARLPAQHSSPVKDETPFNVACALGHLDVVKALDGAGARRNIISSCGMSALHLAAANGQAHVVEYLASKPDVDKESHAFDMNTALHLACAAGRDETVKVM
jgi:ankyrin repeat protein